MTFANRKENFYQTSYCDYVLQVYYKIWTTDSMIRNSGISECLVLHAVYFYKVTFPKQKMRYAPSEIYF